MLKKDLYREIVKDIPGLAGRVSRSLEHRENLEYSGNCVVLPQRIFELKKNYGKAAGLVANFQFLKKKIKKIFLNLNFPPN